MLRFFSRDNQKYEDLQKKYTSLLKEFAVYKKRYNFQNSGDTMPWRYDRLMAKIKYIKRAEKQKGDLINEIARLQNQVNHLTEENQTVKDKLKKEIKSGKNTKNEYMDIH